jgi:serine/threonine protein kinase
MLLANKYRLQKRLGAGGMGEVYRAVNESIGRPVAIKILRPELLRNEDVVQRFLREAKAATLVRHPNVVDVLDVLEHQDIPFIVQELLSGEDLADYAESQGSKLPLDALLAIMIPVVDAVATAHSKGVVHRDLKPANVFLHSADGAIVPKVLDFGISKIITGDTTRVTTTGTALGTPAYMSPEQIEGLAHVDVRSDVWSLGVMLFELAAGVRPFVADTPGALFVKIATTTARSLADVCPDCPRELVEIVAKCLRPEKSQRYDDARGLASALRALASAQSIALNDRLQTLRPRVSIVGADAPEVLAQTLEEAPRPLAVTRAADPETQAAIERVAGAIDPEPVSARSTRSSSSKPRLFAVAIALTLTATTAVFVAGRGPSTAVSTVDSPSTTVLDAAVSPARDAAVSAAPLAVAPPDASAEPADIDATTAVTDAATLAHNAPTRPHRRTEPSDAAARTSRPTPAQAASDSGVPRVRGATTYE